MSYRSKKARATPSVCARVFATFWDRSGSARCVPSPPSPLLVPPPPVPPAPTPTSDGLTASTVARHPRSRAVGRCASSSFGESVCRTALRGSTRATAHSSSCTAWARLGRLVTSRSQQSVARRRSGLGQLCLAGQRENQKYGGDVQNRLGAVRRRGWDDFTTAPVPPHAIERAQLALVHPQHHQVRVRAQLGAPHSSGHSGSSRIAGDGHRVGTGGAGRRGRTAALPPKQQLPRHPLVRGAARRGRRRQCRECGGVGVRQRSENTAILAFVTNFITAGRQRR